MPRSIDADALLDKVLKQYTEHEKNGKLMFSACEIKQDIADMVTDASTIEAEPVKHGRWIFKDDDRMPWCTQAICSHCKKVVANNTHLAVDFGQRDFVAENLYCPNCGAKMDGGAEQ